MARYRKLIITCLVTGAVHTPTMSPHLPLTPDGIVGWHNRRGGGGRFLPRMK